MEMNGVNVSFGARTMYPMMLKKVATDKCRLLKANFAEASTDSVKDCRFVEDLATAWATTNHTNNYIHDIKNCFKDDASFFVKECKYFITRLASKGKKMVDRTATIASVKPLDAKRLKLDLIQSAPKTTPAIKGGGECTLLGIVKYAKEKGYEKIELVSTNDSFYEHMGFLPVVPLDSNRLHNQPTHFLPVEKFDDFISKVEKKYNIV